MAKGGMEGGGVRGSVLPRQGRLGYRDITNPGNLYSILSNTGKQPDSGLSSQSNRYFRERSFLPTLNTDVNIRVEGYRPLRGLSENSRKFHRSTLELSNRAKLPTFTLLRPSASMEDLASLEISARRHNSVHGRLEPTTLPAIRHKRGRVTFEDPDHQKGGLTRVPERDDVFNDDPNFYKEYRTSSLNGDRRIERWVMQMPEDVLDKAHRLLMQEAIRERLLSGSGNTPPDRGLDLPRARIQNKMKISDLRDYSQYPGSYWELRENTVHDPRDLENDMIDRDIYRLRQKSLLKLSSITRDFRDGYGRRGRAMEVSPIPPAGTNKTRHRRRHHAFSPPGPTAQYQTYSESLNVSPAVKFMPAHVPSDADGQSHKTLSMGESSTLPPRIKLSRAAREDVQAAKEKIRNVGRPRDGPKPKVVTLEIGGGDTALAPRLPRHLEDGLLRTQRQSAASSCDSSGGRGNSGPGPVLPTIGPSEASLAETTSSTSNERRVHGKVESRRTMLKGYKQLQVFGELKRQGDRNQGEGESRLIEIPAEPKKYLPPTRAPVYKLDLRHKRRLTSQGALLPQLTDTEHKLASSPLLSMAPKRKETTAISIRFEDGKVILSRNNTTLEEEEKTPKSVARSEKAGEIAADSLQVNPSNESAMT